MLNTICVYCGASTQAAPVYFEAAEQVGRLLAQNGKRVVYGGGRLGLMGTVADAALAAGGEVVGIIPNHLHILERESRHDGLTELVLVESMHERKKLMVDRSDAFIVLPGGFGTLDEFFEIVTWRQLGLHNKPIILYNVNNFWTPFIEAIDNLLAHKFIKPQDRNLFVVANTHDDMTAHLSAS